MVTFFGYVKSLNLKCQKEYEPCTVLLVTSGEFHHRPDPRDHGQEEKHPQHVCHRPCGSW